MSRFLVRVAVAFAVLTSGVAVAEVTTYATFPQLTLVAGDIAVSVDGDVYTADYGGTQVIRIQPDGTTSVFLEDQNSPSGNAFDSKGNFYQSNASDPTSPSGPDSIVKVAPDGSVSTFADGLAEPVGITVGVADTLYVAGCETNTILRIEQGGQPEVIASSSLFRCPNGITFDERGDLFVSNFQDGGVLKITQDGRVSRFADIPGSGNGFVTYVAGKLYVAARNAHQIYSVDIRNGRVALFAGTGNAGSADGANLAAEFDLPSAVERNREGSLLFTNGWNNIVRRIELDLPRPKKPKRVKAKALSQSRVSVSWKHNSFNREGFVVLLATQNSDFEEVGRVGPTARQAVVAGLRPNTTYLVKLQTFNGTSESKRSKQVKVTTKP